VLYLLLQMEQGSLIIGSVLLFAVLGTVMVATRRMDWYALADQIRGDGKRQGSEPVRT
jgi:inner membrane protein